MPTRRNIFTAQYGSAKAERPKGGGPLPPPQGAPPVPLPLRTMEARPSDLQPPQVEPNTPDQNDIEMLLRQLLAQFGGVNGPQA